MMQSPKEPLEVLTTKEAALQKAAHLGHVMGVWTEEEFINRPIHVSKCQNCGLTVIFDPSCQECGGYALLFCCE